MIPIPEDIQGLIKRLLRDTRWTREMIQQVAAGMIVEIQRNVNTKESEMWSFISSIVPDVVEFHERSLDPTALLVEELKEGQPTGRKVEIPNRYREEIHWMLDEIEMVNNSSTLIGGVIMGMNDKVDRAASKINAVLRSRIPECAVGTWQVDPSRMVVMEGLPAEMEELAQRSEGSLEEN
jgi:predicted metal-dependent RNase